jgi:hypothetical protein
MTKFDETQNTLLRFVIQGCKIGADIANAAREITTLRRLYSGGRSSMSSTEKSSAHAHPSTDDHDDTVEAHYASLERPHSCDDRWVTIGQIALDPETGEEVEEFALYLCRRCAGDDA